MACRGLCSLIPFATKKRGGRSTADYSSPYLLGWKYCSNCAIYLKLDTKIVYCPCCNYRMRTKPHWITPTKRVELRQKLQEKLATTTTTKAVVIV